MASLAENILTLEADSLQERLIEFAFGELPEHQRLDFDIELFTQRSELVFGVTITISVSTRTTNRRGIGGKEIQIEGKRVASQLIISEKDIRLLSNTLKDTLFSRISATIVHGISLRLFETDPRIGTIMRAISPSMSSDEEIAENTLPVCPLLDPPSLNVRIPRIQEHPWFRNFTPVLRSNKRETLSHCVLCQKELRYLDEVVWMGGNLLWICLRCYQGERPLISLSRETS